MCKPIRGRSENYPLRQTGAPTPDHQKVGFVDFDNCEEPAHRVSKFFNGLVVEAFEIQMGLGVSEDLLLSFDDCC